jgi:phenylpyruvate tautomerase PptA (4-oxalocrotonate tautomerase family)
MNEACNMTDRRDGHLTRRAIATAALGAGVVAGISAGSTQTAPASSYGAPIVELFVPAGTLSFEQKSELIRRITDVVLAAVSLPPDPPRWLFMTVIETAESGFGVNGKVFVPKRQ